MGIRDRLKKGIRTVKAGLKGLSPEARNPGHPPASPPPTPRNPAPAPEPDKAPTDTDKPWYMEGDIDGWDHTNANGSGEED